MYPKFTQISAVQVTDIVTGNLIACCYALDSNGDVWRRYSDNQWFCLTKFKKDFDSDGRRLPREVEEG